ncbi:TadE-like protein [Corynebacterium poyangense]|uniref:TadE-like protein n=1 Tax=Corynebacterium poyangense TaxID=2684405 RepID=A0A7H0SLN3_9CORY|nr:Rv3654c family TadE-like protein [Corynebacterium poyangense]MBZ8177561.1 TadE-like protein [Corynebacterium poyangense]QNQ89458.1 TadE-like protein [Corynebacterium poyangense]
MSSRQPHDEGYATITAVGIITALISVGLVLMAAGAWVISAHQSQSAAEMAAISAAYAHYQGKSACSEAAEISLQNKATLQSCRVEESDVIVETSVRGRRAQARAGPI